MSDRLDGLPWWARRIQELKGKFSNAGLSGLLDQHLISNRLGELLTTGQVTPDQVRQVLNQWEGRGVEPVSGLPHPIQQKDGWIGYYKDPQAFWHRMWSRLLGTEVTVSKAPLFWEKEWDQIRDYSLLLFYLPAIAESAYPKSFFYRQFKGPYEWQKWKKKDQIPLKERWVLIELLPYAPTVDETHDPIAHALGMHSRSNHSWRSLTRNFAHIAQMVPMSRSARLLTLEESYLFYNMMHFLRTQGSVALPHLLNNERVWTQDRYSSLSAIYGTWDENAVDVYHRGIDEECNDPISFRLLFELK